MELQTLFKPQPTLVLDNYQVSTDNVFIQANTEPMSMYDVEHNHLIPVYVKDNEPVISHQDFINSTLEVVNHVYKNEQILHPAIRVSHPIKGRTPEAKDKPAKDLLEHEKTIYYERMAFVIEIPTIRDNVNGNTLNLTIGGVKSYSLDNLYSKKGGDEHFKVFIGFQNKVCCNLCVWSDGFVGNLKANNVNQLMQQIYKLITNYRAEQQLLALQNLMNYSLTEHQFATLIGKSKLYNYLPVKEKKELPLLSFGDSQINMVARDYYQDKSFCRNDDGSISLWNTYNLFTGANKQSYIDTFLDRGVNAFDFTNSVVQALESKQGNWFLN
ncbi:hypothetical protein GCM10011514_25740 [Emticicia aquatilis]|uniref:DUF3871 family protein n=1 Tax=Emticicia aquatilis TaxID=1537369 RepID=A0A917DRU3_9BACT|nr:DUF3871 family protein [Emticicia aquatilis]GGD60653.1 hypothetical protein GCM10011514_25740 [Emticicia aquatilis]